MERELELEFGMPTVELIPGQGQSALRLSARRTLRHHSLSRASGGPNDGLYQANAALIGWGGEREIRWDSEKAPGGERFACRMEVYLTDPASEPDRQIGKPR